MCDSLRVQSQLNQAISDSKSSHARAFPCCSEAQLDDRELAFLEGRSSYEDPSLVESSVKSSYSSPYRFQLEQDVYRLERQLQEEMQLHSVLQDAMEKNALQLCSSPCLPDNAQKLLTAISTLEVIVSRLEKEMVSLHFQLSQERNERRLAEYRLKNLSSRLISVSPRCFNPSNIELCHSLEDNSRKGLADQPVESTGESSSSESIMEENLAKTEGKSALVEPENLPRGIQPKSLWNQPNKLSEEMVRCMRNIFMSLADSTMPSKSSALENNCSPLSPHGYVSNSSWWSSSERSLISSWVQSPQVDVQSNSEVLASESSFDPYRVRGKFSWAEVGNYGLTTEVSWMSVGKKQLEYASGALRKFRMLVEQLARVNPLHLSCNEKLAFWINLYNALIMHAYLAYGVPRSDLKLFSLMQKAAYTVGGHSFCAAAIEYVILKMKPPLHRPQIALLLALHKFSVSEDQRKCAIDNYEPLVSFALSYGMYSSPAVRVYTGENVKEELEEAQHNFIRASVGVSTKGKLLVPKLLHCFAKSFVDDANLAVWILHYLPPNQAMFVEQCMSQRRQRLLSSRNCGILPFDSRFRYLFLPDKVSLL